MYCANEKETWVVPGQLTRTITMNVFWANLKKSERQTYKNRVPWLKNNFLARNPIH